MRWYVCCCLLISCHNSNASDDLTGFSLSLCLVSFDNLDAACALGPSNSSMGSCRHGNKITFIQESGSIDDRRKTPLLWPAYFWAEIIDKIYPEIPGFHLFVFLHFVMLIFYVRPSLFFRFFCHRARCARTVIPILIFFLETDFERLSFCHVLFCGSAGQTWQNMCVVLWPTRSGTSKKSNH
jgi:hypothetical protein